MRPRGRGLRSASSHHASTSTLYSCTTSIAAGVPTSPLSIPTTDRKSTRLNSSHLVISYAVFCLKKKKNTKNTEYTYTRRETERVKDEEYCDAYFRCCHVYSFSLSC